MFGILTFQAGMCMKTTEDRHGALLATNRRGRLGKKECWFLDVPSRNVFEK
jgi:hypothetical protein